MTGRVRFALFRATVAGVALFASPASAGPPFLTDDPEPTEEGRWEIYAPFADAEGKGAEVSGSFGAEINYGAAPGVQLTLGLPIAFARDASGTEIGAGDLGLSAKYRFLYIESAGLSVAAFPAVTLPTAHGDLGDRRATAFLPVWLQKDAGRWSVFGGGGYAVDPGADKRDHWRGALAVSRAFGTRLLAGVEVEREGADVDGGAASTRWGIGAIVRLAGPLRILARGGPTYEDGAGRPGFHAYCALGVDY